MDSLPGITSKVLSARLNELEDERQVNRCMEAGCFPMKSEYSFTDSRLEIVEIIKGIERWAMKWKIDNNACGNQACEMGIL